MGLLQRTLGPDFYSFKALGRDSRELASWSGYLCKPNEELWTYEICWSLGYEIAVQFGWCLFSLQKTGGEPGGQICCGIDS